MNIAVTGVGYVGLSNALLLSQKNNVVAYDIDEEKITMLNSGVSSIDEQEINDFISNNNSFHATTDKKEAYENADFVIIATPTNYDEKTNNFNIETVESSIREILQINSSVVIVIKSTVPVGFTSLMKQKYNYEKIFFSPEFLREGKSLYDNLYPSRIIIGDKSDFGALFADLMAKSAIKQDIEILFTGLRPGEKLYEELLIGGNVLETEHKLIMRANEEMLPWPELEPILKKLKNCIEHNDYEGARKTLIQAVPEYLPEENISDLMYRDL